MFPFPQEAHDISSILETGKTFRASLQAVFTPPPVAAEDLPITNQAHILRAIGDSVNFGGSACQATFYPCGGADTLVPTLLSDAPLHVLTGGDASESVDDIRRMKLPEKFSPDVFGQTDNTLDSTEFIRTKSENHQLISWGITKALAAKYIKGDNVTALHAAVFKLNKRKGKGKRKKGEGEMTVLAPSVRGDMTAFWITGDNTRTAYVYVKLLLPNQVSQIKKVHKFLEAYSGEQGLLGIRKGMPRLEAEDKDFKDFKELMNVKPEILLRAVISDKPECFGRNGATTQFLLTPYATAFGNTKLVHTWRPALKNTPVEDSSIIPENARRYEDLSSIDRKIVYQMAPEKYREGYLAFEISRAKLLQEEKEGEASSSSSNRI